MDSELSALLEIINTQVSIGVALTTVTLYEFIITLPLEVKVAWGRRPTGVTLLLLTTRWVMVAQSLLSIMPSMEQRFVFAFLLGILNSVFGLSLFLQAAIFSALRIYAMWDRSRILFIIVFVLNMMPFGTNFYAAFTNPAIYIPPPLKICTSISTTPENIANAYTYVDLDTTRPLDPHFFPPVVISTRVSVIAADTLVLILTWIKTFGQQRDALKVGIKVPVTTCLLRDGTVYFFVLLTMNVAELIVARDTTNAFTITPFITAMTPVLISRFILNLRLTADDRFSTDPTLPNAISVPEFRAPGPGLDVMSLGGVLDYEPTARGSDVWAWEEPDEVHELSPLDDSELPASQNGEGFERENTA